MTIATVGLDIAEQVFQVHAADSEGRAVLRKRLQRDHVADFFANLPPCLDQEQIRDRKFEAPVLT